MPAAVDVQYTPDQQFATAQADIAFGDPLSDPFVMPGYALVSHSVDGTTLAATFTNAEIQAAARTAARMLQVPGTARTADGIGLPSSAKPPCGFAQYRFSITAAAGTVRCTAIFARIRGDVG